MLASVIATLRTPCAVLGDTKTRCKQEARGGLTVGHGRQKDCKGYDVCCEEAMLGSGFAPLLSMNKGPCSLAVAKSLGPKVLRVASYKKKREELVQVH